MNLTSPQIPIIDFHTHLFPTMASNLSLSGLNQLLNYHYLRSEYFKSTGNFSRFISPQDIWNRLFFEKNPISEAQRGLAFILSSLNINYQNMTYGEVLRNWDNLKLSQEEIIELLNLKKIIMTIDPLNEKEMMQLKAGGLNSDIWLNSLRLDNYFKKYLSRKISFTSPNSSIPLKKIKLLVDRFNPAYLALSASERDANRIFSGSNLFNFFAYLEEKQLPFFLMLGVDRGVNPIMGDAGDAIADSVSLEFIPKLLRNFSDLKLIVTHMNAERQRQLVSLARAFPNLILGGSWWYRSTIPQLREDINLKLDLLGSRFISYFSDARVDEQLIYKWAFATREIEIICNKLYELQNFTALTVVKRKEFSTSLMTSLLYDYPLELICHR